MANKLEIDVVRNTWFRWLSRGFLLVAAFLPIFVALWPSYPNIHYDYTDIFIAVIMSALPILAIIVLIAWLAPVVGGGLAIIAVPLWLYMQLYERVATHDPEPEPMWVWLFLSSEVLLLLAGGILSIIWGVRKRSLKHNQV
jgi:hypothetical protein